MTQKVYDLMLSLQKLDFSASITLSQLRFNNESTWITLSWGMTKIGILSGSKENTRGLCFQVRGKLFRGWVYITLNYDDTYTVYFITFKGNIKETLTNVYCDELTEKIDYFVETPQKTLSSLYT